MKKDIVKADTDGLYYFSQDLEWACLFDKDDPGILMPKAGAKPLGGTLQEAINTVIASVPRVLLLISIPSN